MEIHRSARKHDIDDDDIVHAFDWYTVIYPLSDVDDGPKRELWIGPDRAGNFLELVVLQRDSGRQLVIHAMPLRAKYWYLLEGGDL